jgi:hypothetical protein
MGKLLVTEVKGYILDGMTRAHPMSGFVQPHLLEPVAHSHAIIGAEMPVKSAEGNAAEGGELRGFVPGVACETAPLRFRKVGSPVCSAGKRAQTIISYMIEPDLSNLSFETN